MKILLNLFIVLFSSIVTLTRAQDRKNNDLIAASQGESSAVTFNMDDPSIPLLKPSAFKDEEECIVRNGLPNFFRTAKSGKKIKVAYLGGSITRSNNMYRLQSAKFIQQMFPNTPMEGINAGTSGTDADLGACRLNEQVLKYNPSLLFIEFAVNGGFAPGVEGIIRQTRKYNPKIDICLIYTVTAEQLKEYKNGNIPIGIKRLDSIAEHYGITSIHMAKEPALLAKENKLVEKGDPQKVIGQLVFSQDGVHPTVAGGDLYAAAIARAFLKMKSLKTGNKTHLPPALYADNWEDAQMLAPQTAAKFSNGWEKLDPDAIGFSAYKNWFPYVMKAEKAGENFNFTFNGSMFGFFDIGGPEVGQLALLVDGKTVKISKNGTNRYRVVDGNEDKLNRFNVYCNNRYRGQFISIELPKGVHTISLSITEEIPDKKKILGSSQLQDITANPAKYNRSVIYIGKILIRGEILK